MLVSAMNVATGEHLEIELDEAALTALAERVARTRRPLTRSQFAAHVGRSLRTVDGWLAAGMPRLKPGQGLVLIQPAPALEWLRARTEGRAA